MNLIPIMPGMESAYFVMSRGALADVPELLKTAFPGKTAWIIADENTWRAAGEKVFANIKAAGIPYIEPKIFPGFPILHPDYAISCELAKSMNDKIVPVAVGSGVLNDLTKCAAGAAGIKYCVVATAASVDGYTSFGGSMNVEGMKKTVPCPAPYAILADIDVLEAAPPEMLAAGYADLLTKVPAGADWFIADAIGSQPIKPEIWDIVQKDLRQWISDPHDLYHVFMGLSATGFAMQAMRDSRPASGAEHLFSHVWEMEKLSVNGKDVSHGFKVGIGLIASTQMQWFIINTPVEQARKMARAPYTLQERKAQIEKLLEKGCYGNVAEVALAKFLEGPEALKRQELLFSKWTEIQDKMKKQIVSIDEFRALLKKAGAPIQYQEIGLDREQYLHGLRTAQLIRKRYTVMDMLYETGLYEEVISRID